MRFFRLLRRSRLMGDELTPRDRPVKMKRTARETFGVPCVCARGETIGGKLMRTSILAILVAFGTVITIPATAQQQTGAQPQIGPDQQQMQNDADKGAKTRNSGESGYVADQEKPGASAHPPGKPDTQQTTTGSGSGTGDRSR
jgi:hypothetical protein